MLFDRKKQPGAEPEPQDGSEGISSVSGKDDPAVTNTGRSAYFLFRLNSAYDYERLGASPYIIIGMETTGPSPLSDEIIELTMIKDFPDGKNITYHSLFNPGRVLPDKTAAETGLTDRKLASAPAIDSEAYSIRDFIGDTMLVTHDAGFVCAFLAQLFNRNGITVSLQTVDTLQLSRQAFPGLKNYSLAALTNIFKLKKGKLKHRAKDDAACTQKLLRVCLEELGPQWTPEDVPPRPEKRSREKEDRAEKYGASPLYDTVFVFCGQFSVPRDVIEGLALSVGAVVKDKVTSGTDYLVVGDIAGSSERADRRNYKKASSLAAGGKNVRTIYEMEFMKMVNSVYTGGEDPLP